jgi:hypothetical protein
VLIPGDRLTVCILYQVKDESAWIPVLKVADREEIYQRLADLKRLLK